MPPDIIGIAIVLFILSMVCERLADFFKHYFGENASPFATWLRNTFGIGKTLKDENINSIAPLTPKEILQAKKDEEKRYFRILKINIWSGFIIALAIHADVFTILKDPTNAYKAMNWSGYSWDPSILGFYNANAGEAGQLTNNIVFFIIGCFCTGMFISFGSKFWHDTLDLLLEVKNAKRLLADPETFKVDRAETIEKMTKTFESDFIQAAFLEIRSQFSQMEHVKAISLKSDEDHTYFVEMVLREDDGSIPNIYPFNLSNGTTQSIRIRKRILGAENIRLHQINLSTQIFAHSTPQASGTLGCLVRSVKPGADPNARFILTCCHNVVFPASKHTNLSQADRITDTSSTVNNHIGNITDTAFDFEIDAAMIQIEEGKFSRITNLIPDFGKPQQPRTLKKKEVQTQHIEAFLYGLVSKRRSGRVISLYNYVEFDMGNGNKEMINLIEISNNGWAITVEGDSGACVVDRQNNVLGLVVGGSPFATYVIPIQTLLTKMKAELV